MKTMKLTLGLVAGAMLMAACAPVGGDSSTDPVSTSGETPTDEATDSTDSGEAVTLRMAGNEYAYTQATIDAFEAANPGVTVEYSGGRIPFEEGIPQSMLRSGEGPDILLANSGPGRVGQLAEAGLIMDLTDFYEQQDLASTYRPFMLEQLAAQGGGRYYEVVEGVDVFEVYYNIQMFEDAGVQPPTDWEGFLANCDALAAADITPMSLGVRGNFAGGWLFGSLLQSSAGQEFMTDVIYNDASFDTPEAVQGSEMLSDLVDGSCLDGQVAASMDFAQMESAFTSGQAAMIVTNQRVILDAERNGTDISQFGSFVLPSRDADRDAAPTAGPSDSWVVNVDTEHPDVAMAWMEFVTSEEYQRIAAGEGMSLVPVREVPSDVELPTPITAAISKLESGAGYNPSVYFPADATAAYYEAMQNLVIDATTPEEATAEIDAALEASR